ncbi:hypothetical protein BPOR_0226g00080 [Botrytis porri]|uniref:Uncharacterized protein n=1 Tax=Botrytis porri TaxID=87229 RepID=A0A4Z1KTF4_9HELO|nr:hypothetical protein BPOR_0226g00080 [Botrytis porri]
MRASEPLYEDAGEFCWMIAKLSFFKLFVHSDESILDAKEAIMRLIVGAEEFVIVGRAEEEEDGALRYSRRAVGPAQRKDVMNAMPVIE